MGWYDRKHRDRGMKSFVAFLSERQRDVYDLRKPGKFKCNVCHGSGQVVAPWEKPDIIEGHKMSERVPCTSCNGTGEWTEKKWREQYLEERSEYLAMRREERERDSLRKSGLKKLTIPERFALGLNVYDDRKKRK